MDNFITNLNWKDIGQVVLLVVMLLMLVLFRRPSSDSQKALKIGAGFFIIAIFFSIVGLTQISDYFSVLGFTTIFISLLRLFWSDTSKSE